MISDIITKYYKYNILAATTIIFLLIAGCSCVENKGVAAKGQLLNKTFNIKVDDTLAKKLLLNQNDSEVAAIFEKFKKSPLSTATLATLSKEYSTDVATFYFVQELYKIPKNNHAQNQYYQYLLLQQCGMKQPIFNSLKDYYIVFVPGFAYKQDTTTGADFARQRRLLTGANISNDLISIDEWGLIENNANYIAQYLKNASLTHKKIIVVSASKGGLETANALGKILLPSETKNITAWINVGGILRGSPVADNYLHVPKKWLAQCLLWLKGKNFAIVKDMSYKTRKHAYEQLHFPRHLKIINLVGAPLAMDINKNIKSRYCSMINLGPNDGLSPLADMITNDDIVITEVGLDHYFKDKDIDKKTLALALVAITNQ